MNRESLIYVAGHTGLVGSAIVRALRGQGFARLLTRTRGELDLTCQRQVNDFFASHRPEFVFLAAAKVGGIQANATRPAEFIRDNLLIQSNVIDAAHRNGTGKLLFLGSSCIYPRDCPQPIREEYLLTGPLEPTNESYAVAKIAGIRMCQAYRRQYGFNSVCLMPTNLYGPGDNFDLESSHVLPALLRKFHLAKLAGEEGWDAVEADERRWGPIPDDVRNALGVDQSRDGPAVVLWGTGAPLREFLHVDDLAAAAIFTMQSYDGAEILNVGTGMDLSISELAEMVQQVVGYRGEVHWDHDKSDGTPRKCLDVTRLSQLGGSAQIELREGLESLYHWYCTQP